ncbi:hypothetical protein [Shewanella colwelliana]|uniref:hypothetical protein n=1 Tax=Shewanella colwelliana TaxID=23 RepID=UPI001C7D23FF|nr:hypothetical protein [Shewanella colwelliana]
MISKPLFKSSLSSKPAAITIRLLMSVLGGYGVASLSCVLLSQTLPLEQVDAILVATMLSFAVFCTVVIRVFSVRSLRQVIVEPLMFSTSLYLLTVMGS